MHRLIDLTGGRFGRLRVLSRAPNDARGRVIWRCVCDCGEASDVLGQRLRTGETRSCGCLARDRIGALNASHGETKGRRWSSEYRALNGMIRRCYEESHISFPRYGARGIGVCDRWRFGEAGMSGVECFVADVGRRPSAAHSIDRWPDNDGNYEPGNVRWAVPLEQSANSRRSRRVRYRGVEMTLKQACEAGGAGVARGTVVRRLNALGWSVEAAVETRVS